MSDEFRTRLLEWGFYYQLQKRHKSIFPQVFVDMNDPDNHVVERLRSHFNNGAVVGDIHLLSNVIAEYERERPRFDKKSHRLEAVIESLDKILAEKMPYRNLG